MKLSKYSRIIELEPGGTYCLANTINKALVSIPANRVNGQEIVYSLFTEEELAMLEDMGFFVSDENGEQTARKLSSSSRRVSISIETSLECNLRCPYCYQGQKKDSPPIPKETLDIIASWVERVFKEDGEVRELSVKVLGGEPSIQWASIEPTLRRVSAICQEFEKRFILMIDTNGCSIEPFRKLDYADKILFTIPVTHQSCHDSVRMTASGEGTYDTVLRNAMELQQAYPESTIVLRHNTDEKNAPLFGEYLDDLSARGFMKPLVDISYTASFQNTEYRNGMSYPDYQAWRKEIAIPLLLDHSFPVLVSPAMNLNPCQRLERHSFKVFSDGTIGYCAMDYFASNRAESASLLDSDSDFFKERPTIPEKCFRCESFFVCGGSYELPCIRSLGVEACKPDGAFNIDFSDFVRIYMDAPDKTVFYVFNQDEIVR